MDIHAEAIYTAKEHYSGPEYVIGDIGNPPDLGMFRTVVSMETIEHLPDPLKALDWFRSICDGVLVCSVPNEEKYQFRADVFKDDEYPHLRHYTPTQFDELLWEAGWAPFDRQTQDSKVGDCRPGTDGLFLVYACR